MSYSFLYFWPHSDFIAALEFSLAVGMALGCGPQAGELSLAAVAQLLLSMWTLPGPGMEPAPSALAGSLIHGATRKVLTNTF